MKKIILPLSKIQPMDISSIKPGINRVLVQLHPHNDRIAFNGGELLLDTSYEPQDHISVIGKVISVGKIIACKTYIHSDVRLDWEPEQVLQPDDIIFLDYHTVLMALGQRGAAQLVEGGLDTFFTQEGFIFVFIPYYGVLLSVRDNKFVMPNGFVLVKRLLERPVTGLYVPEYLENKPSKTKCEVVAAGLPNRRYFDKKYSDAYEPLEPGTKLIVDNKGWIKLENDMHATLPKDFYVIQRRWILGSEEPEKSCLHTVDE